jgi:type VI secretion system secreted protein VgrG
MPVEQDVQLLSDRVRALEARLRVLEDMLGGSRIALEAGGNSIVISPQGIEISTGSSLSINVSSDYTLRVARNATITAQGDCQIAAKNAAMTVTGNIAIAAGGQASTTVGGNAQSRVGGSISATAGRDVVVTAATDIHVSSGRNVKADVGHNLEMNARKHATLISGNDLSLKTGDASMVAKKDGEVTIRGKDISIDASGKISCKAASELILKGQKVLQN